MTSTARPLNSPPHKNRHHSPRRFLLAGAAAALGAVLFALATGFSQGARDWQPIGLELDDIAGRLGFGLDQVSLSGHRFTPDGDIFDALDLSNVRSHLSFDSRAAKARIERLPWVDTAFVTRVLPDGLAVDITERSPFAVWRHDGRDILIDRTGRSLGPIARSATSSLPVVAGQDAAVEAVALFDMLGRFPALQTRVAAAERIDGRRWALRIDGDRQVLLPASGEAAAIEQMMSGSPGRRLIDQPAAIIDLRSPSRVFLIPATDGKGAGAPPDRSGAVSILPGAGISANAARPSVRP